MESAVVWLPGILSDRALFCMCMIQDQKQQQALSIHLGFMRNKREEASVKSYPSVP